MTTFDENLRAVGMLDDMRDKKEDKCRGWKGKTPAISARLRLVPPPLRVKRKISYELSWEVKFMKTERGDWAACGFLQ